jgi:hypothetical protein
MDLRPKTIADNSFLNIEVVCNYKNIKSEIINLSGANAFIEQEKNMKICQFEFDEIKDSIVDDLIDFVFTVTVYKYAALTMDATLSSMARNLYVMMHKNKVFTDLHIICSNQVTLKSHRAIFSISSKVFEAMLASTEDQKSTTLIFVDTDSELMDKILKFIYNREVDVNLENAFMLLQFNQKYNITDFKEYCFDKLVRSYGEKLEHALDLMTLAYEFDEQVLFKNCINRVKM